jgi:hypothetical protein
MSDKSEQVWTIHIIGSDSIDSVLEAMRGYMDAKRFSSTDELTALRLANEFNEAMQETRVAIAVVRKQ